MFTGIITHIGTVRELVHRPEADVATIVVDAPGVLDGLPEGGSLAVDGVCLTALHDADAEPGVFRADLMGQTLRMTALGDLAPGSRVNLERCLLPHQHLDGHLVQGHVDGVGTVLEVADEGAWHRVRVGVPARLARYLPAQGAVALQGASLTITAVSSPDAAEHWFEVGLIPATLAATTFDGLEAGRRLNVETDVMARYAERLAQIPAPRDATAPADQEEPPDQAQPAEQAKPAHEEERA
ncbi:Riboflavin synthase eubacterial/eukaryotic [Micrococcus lylae]|uniref:Riboflavin synthase n=1 Tax=Micrococcus lylae TaxID=1273 RepID=A0A1R4IDZ4_9MICC|nr:MULTISPECIES: riboflavin synthase [Micrococcus]OFR86309.1 riboflavin synthase subunit alpha [Micrococcus sp. HMSC067E09]PNL17939.1 riboflavin synthase subunit alpha [Micrococcus sp. FDAARGOS_333]TFI00870.1 riboflavin synthase [Micrococcus lylae]WIK82815.1 riboflavin synthase [Micrococcus lylae]SJN17966.1 Riboflavin synthase eubacterial/eukaryotic [Micrococcus lylae]